MGELLTNRLLKGLSSSVKSKIGKDPTNAPYPLVTYPPQPSKALHWPSKSSKEFTQMLFASYWDFPISAADKSLQEQPAHFWIKAGEKRALDLFRAAAKRVPAYKDFLRKNNIKPGKVRSMKNFQDVPPINKKNYLLEYPMKALSWDGKLEESQMISVSSGSSGEPFFWPRASLLELETTYVQENYLKTFFHIHQRPTLYLDCFAMGMYIAGPIILNSALRVSQKGYPMMIITPGLSMDDIMKVLPNISPLFEQIILAGYPPYIKDVIEEAINAGVDWKKVTLKLILAGEGFTEKWRDYVAEMAGNINVYTSFINIYGTADASIVGHETPESIAIRRAADRDLSLQCALFGDRYPGRLPTLVQYYPTQKYFEAIDNELHFTATSGIPLIRYNIHDDGGVIPYDNVAAKMHEAGVDVQGAMKTEAPGMPSWKLPFVYLYGRSDFTVVFYGANVYPENIKDALDSEQLRKYVTGRFLMTVDNDQNQDQYLLIRIELGENVRTTASLRKKIQDVVLETLLTRNDEFRSSYNAKGEKAIPVTELYARGDEEYFTRRRHKQRWTEKKH